MQPAFFSLICGPASLTKGSGFGGGTQSGRNPTVLYFFGLEPHRALLALGAADYKQASRRELVEEGRRRSLARSTTRAALPPPRDGSVDRYRYRSSQSACVSATSDPAL